MLLNESISRIEQFHKEQQDEEETTEIDEIVDNININKNSLNTQPT